MSDDVKLEVIRNTQESLSKYIKKPPLTEKLLRKPPFRYLHDITTAVMRETGFLQGLYSQDELNPENIKDREAKIAFLEKLIAAVNLSTGVTISARPNKIVAGLDVTKTNELLQTIGKALEKKVDSSQAVEKVLTNKTKDSNQKTSTKKESNKIKTSKEGKAAETRVREPRTSDVLKKKSKEVKSKNVNKPQSKTEKISVKETPPTKLIKEPTIEETLEKPEIVKKDNVIPEENNVPDKLTPDAEVEPSSSEAPNPPQESPSSPNRAQERSKPSESVDSLLPQPDNTQLSTKEDPSKPVEEELKRPQSARAVHRKKPGARKPNSETGSNEKGEPAMAVLPMPGPTEPTPSERKPEHQLAQSEVKESKRPRTAARPASARPGAPRVRDRGTILLPGTDKKMVSEPVNVIVDSKVLPKDDDETLVTVEAPTSLSEAAVDKVVDDVQLLSEGQGHLVSQILETKKELEDPTASEGTSKVDIRWDKSSSRETVNREMDNLQAAIQALTRAANPLGKLIDFLQEDVDSMQTELHTWVTTNHELSKQLQAEERLTEQSIEPLVIQLEELNQLIEEQLEETSVVKASIIRNDERLTRLLQSSSSHLG